MNKSKLIIFLILILAFCLRFFKVGEIPSSVYGDEMAFAWNAFNILKTGTDEYGTPYPLQFRSFDDYKSPLPVYVLVPVIKILGMNAWSIRIVVSAFSLLTILSVYLLCQEIFKLLKYKPVQTNHVSLFVSFLLTISAWHIHLSRGYFEATIGLFFLTSGAYLFIKGKQNTVLLFLSALAFGLSLYSYFTPRIILPPLIILLMLFTYNQEIKKNLRRIVLFLLTLFILIVPLINLSIFSSGANRFLFLMNGRITKISETATLEQINSSKSLIIRRGLHNKWLIFLRQIKDDYLEHFSINFWYLYGDNSLRYFLGNMGMFYFIEMPFLIMGFATVLKKYSRAGLFFLVWLMIAAIPGALVGRSFAVRDMNMLPAPFFFVGTGIISFYLFLKNKYFKVKNSIIRLVISLIIISGFSLYLIRYYHDYPVYGATWWGYENKIALDYAFNNQDKYDAIFISNYYTGLDLAFAFYTSFDPPEFRKVKKNPVIINGEKSFLKFGKFYIGSFDLNDQLLHEKVIPAKSLYIGGPLEPVSAEKIIAPGDQRILFNIYRQDE